VRLRNGPRVHAWMRPARASTQTAREYGKSAQRRQIVVAPAWPYTSYVDVFGIALQND